MEARIVLALQPIVRSGQRSRYGYEILSRIKTPDGISGPLAYARQHGWAHCDIEVGHLLKCWVEGRLHHYKSPLFLNLSAATMSSQENFQAWADCVKLLTKERPDSIVIEISEEVSDSDLDDRWDSVKKLGCRIAMDDLGSAGSTLDRAAHYPWDICKIDAPYELGKLHEAGSLPSLMRGGELIVECIETLEQAEQAKAMGVVLQQGYFHGRPMLVNTDMAVKPMNSSVPCDARTAYGKLYEMLLHDGRL